MFTCAKEKLAASKNSAENSNALKLASLEFPWPGIG